MVRPRTLVVLVTGMWIGLGRMVFWKRGWGTLVFVLK